MNIVEQQAQLAKLSNSIEKKLNYFTELNKISIKLTNQHASVYDSSFFATLAKLDECIAFASSNVNQKKKTKREINISLYSWLFKQIIIERFSRFGYLCAKV